MQTEIAPNGVVFHLRTRHRRVRISLTVNFMSKKITLEFDEEDADEIIAMIRELMEREAEEKEDYDQED